MRAYRWLAVAPPVEVEITSVLDGDRVDVEIAGYSRATVRLADRYVRPPDPSLPPLANPRPTPVTGPQMYADRWMFHGPRYAGVAALPVTRAPRRRLVHPLAPGAHTCVWK